MTAVLLGLKLPFSLVDHVRAATRTEADAVGALY